MARVSGPGKLNAELVALFCTSGSICVTMSAISSDAISIDAVSRDATSRDAIFPAE